SVGHCAVASDDAGTDARSCAYERVAGASEANATAVRVPERSLAGRRRCVRYRPRGYGTQVVGYALWALILAGALVLEGLGLTLAGHQWPTVSDLLRSLTKPVAGRWTFFALWLWMGWHFFIRGWEFFLRGSGAQKPAGPGGGKDLKSTIVQGVVPLLALFVL